MPMLKSATYQASEYGSTASAPNDDASTTVGASLKSGLSAGSGIMSSFMISLMPSARKIRMPGGRTLSRNLNSGSAGFNTMARTLVGIPAFGPRSEEHTSELQSR